MVALKPATPDINGWIGEDIYIINKINILIKKGIFPLVY